MAQLTIRVPSNLVDRLRSVASGQALSVNAYVTAVLEAATDPALAGNEAERLRERLRHAGLLAEGEGPAPPRPRAAQVARARAAAGTGTPLSTLVTSDR